MSKKKNKKKSYYDYAYGGKKKDKNKKKKNKSKGYYEEPQLKSVKPSLDKSEIKEQKKILVKPIKIPEQFTENRAKCNHADGLLTVAEFRAMTPNYGAFTPMLDTIVNVFGEENVAVCKMCYDVVVDPSTLDTGDLIKCISTMYAAANVVVSRKRMKKDEIKEIAKIKNKLADWNEIIERLAKLEASGALDVTKTPKTSGGISDADLAKLNRGDQAFVQ